MRKFSSRILAIYAIAFISFFIFKSLAVPATFGEFGWYRGESVKEIANTTQKFAGANQCFDCHVDEYVLWSLEEHKNVRCESCHGALKAHVLDPEKYEGNGEYLSPKAYPTIVDFCLSCHDTSSSKPESFPQVSISQAHAKYWDCLQCHNPHDPIS